MVDFLKSLKSLTGPRSYLGVDIGTTSIKIVEIEKTSQGPQLTNYGIIESFGYLKRFNEAIQTSSLKIATKETAEMLKTLVQKANFKTKNVIASIPAFAVFNTFLEIPEMPMGDTVNALKFQIPKYVPLPPEEMSIDWLKIDQWKDEKGIPRQRILVTAVPNERVRKYQEIFKLADLKLNVLEVESLSLVRAFTSQDDEPTLILDIGSRSTNIVIASKGFLRYSAQTDYAGLSLTQAIASGFGIDTKRAEELKRQKGIIVRAEEYELSTLTLPFLDVIISEVKRAKAAYEKDGGMTVGRIILVGGSANLLGLPKYFEEQTGLKTTIGNPFRFVNYLPQIELMVKELGPLLGLAIGLGTKEFV